MIGLSDRHKLIPTEYKANLRFRDAVLLVAAHDPVVQKKLMKACREDFLLWIKLFVWQSNPLKDEQHAVGPFIPYEYQEHAITAQPKDRYDDANKGLLWCYHNKKTMAVQKSRTLGASWIMLMFQVWLCLFFRHRQCLNISRNEAAVDDGTPDSLFWKMKFINKYLPRWMTGDFKTKKNQEGNVDEQKLYIGYEKQSSVIKGEASTERAGVGGRASFVNVDEFSKIQKAIQVRQRTANTADFRVFTGTHEGVGTEFFRLTDHEQSPEIVVQTWHWTMHPEMRRGMYMADPATGLLVILDKTYEFPLGYPFILDGSPTGGYAPGIRSPYYDKKSDEIGNSRGVAMELDIDPMGATKQFFNQVMLRNLISSCIAPTEWDLECDETGKPALPYKLVRKPGGPLKLWITLEHGNLVPPAKYVAGSDISWGTGATNTCLSIVNSITGLKVAEYVRPDIEPTPFAYVVFALCKLFTDENGQGPLFAWEMQGPGIAFAKTFLSLGYRNVYCQGSESPHTLKTKRSVTPGWVPSAAAIVQLLNEYEVALRSKRFTNYSVEALKECLNFKYNDSGGLEHANIESRDDPSGARVNHGDRVIADSLANKMCGEISYAAPTADVILAIPENSIAGRRANRDNASHSVSSWFSL